MSGFFLGKEKLQALRANGLVPFSPLAGRLLILGILIVLLPTIIVTLNLGGIFKDIIDCGAASNSSQQCLLLAADYTSSFLKLLLMIAASIAAIWALSWIVQTRMFLAGLRPLGRQANRAASISTVIADTVGALLALSLTAALSYFLAKQGVAIVAELFLLGAADRATIDLLSRIDLQTLQNYVAGTAFAGFLIAYAAVWLGFNWKHRSLAVDGGENQDNVRRVSF